MCHVPEIIKPGRILKGLQAHRQAIPQFLEGAGVSERAGCTLIQRDRLRHGRTLSLSDMSMSSHSKKCRLKATARDPGNVGKHCSSLHV